MAARKCSACTALEAKTSDLPGDRRHHPGGRGDQQATSADKGVLDAALGGIARRRIEHYEITRYGTLIAWAKRLGRNDCARCSPARWRRRRRRTPS